MVWLLEPEEPEEFDGVPDDSEPPGVVPVPPLDLGCEPVCVGAGNEVMASVEPGEGAM